MKNFGEKGITLVEVTISLLLFGVLGMAIFNTLNFSKRVSDNATEDIQLLISQYGASKLIAQDLNGSLPSFNFIHILDDSNRPFFVWATNELCQQDCNREIQLKMGNNLISDKILYLIVSKGKPEELEKFIVDPEVSLTLSGTSLVYHGVNRYFNQADYSISKQYRPYSPWSKERLLLLSTLASFNDCNNLISGTEEASTSCKTYCSTPGSCNFAATRPIKFLGYVNNQEKDLVTISNVLDSGRSKIPLNLHYRFCQQSTGADCINAPQEALKINSAQSLMKNMPYIPGKDNRAFLTPVELVRYYLKKNNANDPSFKVQLVREKGFLKNGRINWGSPVILITGIESLNFKRPNISDPIIEYDIKLIPTRVR